MQFTKSLKDSDLQRLRELVREKLRREREAARRQPYSLGWLRKYLGHHLYLSSFSQFHSDLAGDLNHAATARNQKLNYRGPRGNAKTTIGTVGYTLWCIVEGREPFTLLLSEESQLSSGVTPCVDNGAFLRQ